MVLVPDVPKHDRTRGEAASREVEGSQERGVALPPIDLVVRVWFDRDPEVLNPGLAVWAAQAALYRAAESLEEGLDGPSEEETDGDL